MSITVKFKGKSSNRRKYHILELLGVKSYRCKKKMIRRRTKRIKKKRK